MIIFITLNLFFFFFNDTATTEIYTLSLHDALPIPQGHRLHLVVRDEQAGGLQSALQPARSEEHTSELQSRLHLVCRLLLEKKKNILEKPSRRKKKKKPKQARD